MKATITFTANKQNAFDNRNIEITLKHDTLELCARLLFPHQVRNENRLRNPFIQSLYGECLRRIRRDALSRYLKTNSDYEISAFIRKNDPEVRVHGNYAVLQIGFETFMSPIQDDILELVKAHEVNPDCPTLLGYELEAIGAIRWER